MSWWGLVNRGQLTCPPAQLTWSKRIKKKFTYLFVYSVSRSRRRPRGKVLTHSGGGVEEVQLRPIEEIKFRMQWWEYWERKHAPLCKRSRPMPVDRKNKIWFDSWDPSSVVSTSCQNSNHALALLRKAKSKLCWREEEEARTIAPVSDFASHFALPNCH